MVIASNMTQFKASFLVEKAKMFKDELMRLNQKRNNVLNLPSLRLGINSIISLSSTLPIKDVVYFNTSIIDWHNVVHKLKYCRQFHL